MIAQNGDTFTGAVANMKREWKGNIGVPAGTVLDGRYEIQGVIRQGGFGITYEAVHIQSGRAVAVKEYFNRDICVRVSSDAALGKQLSGTCRNVGKTSVSTDDLQLRHDLDAAEGHVTVADPADLPRFEADRARFLREARILREYAQESSVVTVLDYFEEKGTAYIVMEYLEAKTLREEICHGGTWNMEQAMRRFEPVMEVLGRIHAAGLLHRDISPDNIMVMEDGNLRLIDFGAAREISDLTHSAIYTAGYAAPEQRDPRGQLGSWTDVYGLCGVICFCLTGRDPEDALSRLLYDELECPSDSGADILPRAEQILMQGLALEADSRIHDMSLLREELQKYYPLLTDVEKERERERRRRRWRRAGAAAAGLLFCIGLVCAVFRTQIRFRFIDTQVTALDGSDMTPEEFKSNAEAVKRRVEALAGKGNFLWRVKEGQQILFELPARIYGNADPEKYAAGMIAGRNRIWIHVEEWRKEDSGESGQDEKKASWTELDEGDDPPYRTEEGFYRLGYYRLGMFDQQMDLESVRRTEEGTEIVLSEDARERFRGALEDTGRKVVVTFDEDNGEFTFDEGVIIGDGKGILMHGVSMETASIPMPYTAQFDILRYTEKPLSASFGVECVWKIKWEETNASLLPGENQVNAEDVPAPFMDLSYLKSGELLSGRDLPDQRGYNATLVGIQAIIKNRLDGLGIPYAVGIDQSLPSVLVVRMPTEGICRETVENLGRYMTFHIGDEETFSDVYLAGCSLEVEEKKDGDLSLALVIPKLKKPDIENTLAKMEKRGDEKVFLYVMDRKIASADFGDAIRSMERESRITFVHWPFSGNPSIDSTGLSLLRFLSACIEQNPDHSFILRAEQFTDTDGIAFFQCDMLPVMYPNPGAQWVQQWNREHEDYNVSYDELDKVLYVSIFDCRLDDPGPGLESLWSVFQKAQEAQVPVQEVMGVLYERRREDPAESNTHQMYIWFKRDFDSGSVQLSRGNPSGFDRKDQDTVNGLCEIYNAYVRESPFWKEKLTGYYGNTPFFLDN